jgi:hypothetical protein
LELDLLNMEKIPKIKEYNTYNIFFNNDLIYYSEKNFYARWIKDENNEYQRFGIRLSFILRK